MYTCAINGKRHVCERTRKIIWEGLERVKERENNVCLISKIKEILLKRIYIKGSNVNLNEYMVKKLKKVKYTFAERHDYV